MKFCLQVHGCQMNVAEGRRMAELLTAAGAVPVDDLDGADVAIVHTCCVRQSAEDRIFGQLGQLKRWKRERPGRILGVTGCMAQLHGDALIKRCPHVDFVLGTARLGELVSAVASRWPSSLPEQPRAPRPSPLTALVPVMHGCDNFCSYCIVPYVRGRERSRPVADVLGEIRAALANGCREVTLLGQNVNSYAHGFAALLRAVDALDGLARVRFMTSHPKDLGDDLIDALATGRHLCEHVHLPVQHGSDAILAAMNRHYTVGQYRRLLDKLRDRVPGVAVTTDLIVGFPGESDDDFAATLDLVRHARFDAAYTFLYSPRSGTPAAALPHQVDDALKHARLQQLMAVQADISLERNRALVGSAVEVLVEGGSRTDPDTWTGRTRTGKIVLWPHADERVGQLRHIDIDTAQTWTLRGRLEE